MVLPFGYSLRTEHNTDTPTGTLCSSYRNTCFTKVFNISIYCPSRYLKFFCKQKAYEYQVFFPMPEGSITFVEFSPSDKSNQPMIHLESSENTSTPLQSLLDTFIPSLCSATYDLISSYIALLSAAVKSNSSISHSHDALNFFISFLFQQLN